MFNYNKEVVMIILRIDNLLVLCYCLKNDCISKPRKIIFNYIAITL